MTDSDNWTTSDNPQLGDIVYAFSDQPNGTQKNSSYNSGGGGNMDDRYVTHEELDHAVSKLSAKMDLMEAHIDNNFLTEFNPIKEKLSDLDKTTSTKFETINTKFANQKVWFFGTAISIISGIVAVLALFGHIK